MDTTTRDSLLAAVGVPGLMTILMVVLVGPGMTCVSNAILAFCFAPLGVFGAMMLVRPDAGRWVNLPVSSGYEYTDRIAHMFGASIVIGTVVISSAVSLMMQGGSLHTGLVLLAVSVAIIVLPMAYVRRRPADFWCRSSGWSHPAKSAVILASAVLAVAPIAVCELVYEGSSRVCIELDDEHVTVTAPMFDHTIRYDEIDDIRLDDDFDRGHRVFGYSGADIGSGSYRNADLGDYELAAYKDVRPCILVSSGGEVYAFNRSTAEETMAVYTEILMRAGMTEI